MRFRTFAIALCTASICGPSFAIEYSPPTGAWYQVLTADFFEEVCTTSTAPCDIPAGNYVLINFGTDPATRTSLTLPRSGTVGEDPANPLGLVFVDETCKIGGNVERCEVSCPVGSAVVGVTTCNAYWVDTSGPGGGLVRPVPTAFERSGTGGAVCLTMPGALVSVDAQDDTIEVGVTCAPYSR